MIDLAREAEPATAVVDVRRLTVTVPSGSGSGRVDAVRDVSLVISSGEALGLVGESGSGKTLTCRAILGVLSEGCEIAAGEILFHGQDVTTLSPQGWQHLRGVDIGAVFQDPASYLNPSLPVGEQLAEVLRVKLGLRRRDARERAVELLRAMGLRRPEVVYRQLPAELSGGMIQRVLIATAICCDPQLLVADEATTALDVTVQAEVLELLGELRDRGLAVLFVSHDLGAVADLCDRVVVFYGGEIMEIARTGSLVDDPLHPYTRALLEIVAPATAADGDDVYLPVIPGRPPAPGEVEVGCRFAARCPFATEMCRAADVALREVEPGRWVRCVLGTALRGEG